MNQSFNDMLAFYMGNWNMHWGEHHSWGGGTPLWQKKCAVFYTSSKKPISLGNLTILSFQIRTFEPEENCPGQPHFHVCVPFSFDEEPLEIFYVYVLATEQPQNVMTWYCKILKRCLENSWQ